MKTKPPKEENSLEMITAKEKHENQDKGRKGREEEQLEGERRRGEKERKKERKKGKEDKTRHKTRTERTRRQGEERGKRGDQERKKQTLPRLHKPDSSQFTQEPCKVTKNKTILFEQRQLTTQEPFWKTTSALDTAR